MYIYHNNAISWSFAAAANECRRVTLCCRTRSALAHSSVVIHDLFVFCLVCGCYIGGRSWRLVSSPRVEVAGGRQSIVFVSSVIKEWSKMEFVLGALGASGAVCFTNPLEVIKTRFQLQGELKKVGNYKVHYRNFAHAIYVVAKNEGPLALQKGLLPAMGHQVFLNGTRLGIFDLAQKKEWILKSDGTVSLIKSALVGAGAGMLGGFLGSPLGMLKIHLQSFSAQSIAVGHQHNTTSTINGLLTLYRKYGVVRGLWRGATGAMVRIGVASAMQLSTISLLNEALIDHKILTKDQKFLSTLICSMLGGVLMSIVMAPFDLVSTRLYNQAVDAKGRGLLYLSYMECLTKTFKQEGIYGLYKGVVPCYLRLGPHVILSMVFWDRLRQFESNVSNHIKAMQSL